MSRVFDTINNDNLFALLNKSGIKYKSPLFLLIAVYHSLVTLVDSNSNANAIENISSKKISLAIKATKRIGSSVYRNKTKRRIRHIIHSIFTDDCNLVHPRLLLVIPYKGCNEINFVELKQMFVNNLQKNHLKHIRYNK